MAREDDTGPSLGSLAACACFSARTAARAITDLYDRTLSPTGLRLSQVAILATVERRHGATMQEIATELSLDPSTMTRTLRPLEDGGLVRTQPGNDKRAKMLELTAAGRSAFERALVLWETAQQTLRLKIGNEVFERFHADLAAVTQDLRS
jgi:DNA-binding MarR family transcriptional regulator